MSQEPNQPEVSPIEKYKQIKDNIGVLSDKIAAFEREKATLEGQRANILSSAGVSSEKELEEIVAQKKEAFEKEVSALFDVFLQVKEKVDKIEEMKRSCENS